MALNMKTIPIQITSAALADTNGAWIRVGGMSMDVQFHNNVGAFNRLEVSSDKQDADIATDADGANITALGAVYREVRERPQWARAVVLADGVGGVLWASELLIHKEDS